MKAILTAGLLTMFVLLVGCDKVSKADISNAIQLCEGHHGLDEIVPTKNSEDYNDVYCNDGSQHTMVAKIPDTSCKDIDGKKYCN